MESLFITGTDTGVGKTLVTALLALRLQARGVDVGLMKPFASGCLWQDGELVSEDALWLRDVTGVNDSLWLINPVRFNKPLAPLVAARRMSSSIAQRDFFDEVLAAFAALRSRHECVLVEGVGGLLVPLQEGQRILTCADLAGWLGLPVVVVARRTLGTINHTALTCRVPLEPPAHFAGLVFCDAQPVAEDDVAAQTSPDIVAAMTGLPVWGRVPHLRDLSRLALMAAAEQFLEQP